MRDSRKNLLQLIYDCDQREGRPLQINSDGKDISSDTLTLRNDVRYLKDNGYIRETNPILHSYVLTLTEKGEYFVENGFRLPEAHPPALILAMQLSQMPSLVIIHPVMNLLLAKIILYLN